MIHFFKDINIQYPKYLQVLTTFYSNKNNQCKINFTYEFDQFMKLTHIELRVINKINSQKFISLVS